tara:strand:+ start:1933 stop:2100 length:168 start_codon:yes stop_codon:yes gene_type:complete
MKQLELDLKIKGTSKFDDVPTLKELIERKRKRPKHLENLSDKHYKLITELFRGRF